MKIKLFARIFLNNAALGGWAILLLIIIKAYPGGIIVIDFNNFGEYNFEIILFCIIFITILIFKIIDMKALLEIRNKEKKKRNGPDKLHDEFRGIKQDIREGKQKIKKFSKGR